jgi:hypothetical protein
MILHSVFQLLSLVTSSTVMTMLKTWEMTMTRPRQEKEDPTSTIYLHVAALSTSDSHHRHYLP